MLRFLRHHVVLAEAAAIDCIDSEVDETDHRGVVRGAMRALRLPPAAQYPRRYKALLPAGAPSSYPETAA